MCIELVLSQQNLQIKDKATNLPLQHVELLSDENVLLGTSNENGFVSVPEGIDLIFIEHPGFPAQSFSLTAAQKIILLDSDLVNLKTIEVVANDDKSLNLIRKVIENQKINSPKALKNYQYNSYTKLWMDAQGDSIDYLAIPKTSSDSAQNNTKKLLEKSMLFLSERAITHLYDSKLGVKNVVEAARISGLKTPLYELIALQPISTEFNDNEFDFFFRKFTNPLSKAGLRTYNYIITDTLILDNRTVVQVSFNSKKKEKKSLYGYAEIDLASYALSKFYAENQTKAGSDTYIEMVYSPYKNVWIPARQIFKIEAENLSYVSRQDSITPQGEKVDKIINKKAKTWLNSHTSFTEFKSPITLDSDVFKGHENEVNKEAFKNFNEKIAQFRADSLSKREFTTYLKIDSIGKEQNVDRSIKLFRILSQQGWLNLGKVDYYLPDVLQFNDYEDYRFGLNLRTNTDFSQKFGLNARTYYGLTDRVLKYGFGGWMRINSNMNSEIFVDFSDDITSSGRFEQPNFNLLNVLNYRTEQASDYLFIDKVTAKFGYRQDLFRNINIEVSLNTSKERSLFPYQFQGNTQDKSYRINTIQAALRYAPKEHHIQTPMGKFTFKSDLPTYYLNMEHGLNLFSEETDFTRIEFSTNQRLNIFNTSTLLNLRLGKVFGEVPLWHYFDNLGRARNKEGFWQRARIGGSQIFETMPQGEFISDQYAFASIKQRMWNVKLVKNKNIPVHVVYKLGYGSLDNGDHHSGINFQEMNKVYQEAGLEINNLFLKVFGLGLYYRFGAYNQDDFENDFSLKATFNFGI